MSEVAPPPIPASVARPGLRIARSIALAVVFYVVVTAVSIPVYAFKQSGGLALDPFTALSITLVIAWPITILLGLQWSGASLREACPLRPFPARIVPALLATSIGAAILLGEVVGWIPMSDAFRKEMFEQWATSSKLSVLLAAVLIAPVAEELFFRGLVLHGYLGRYTVTKAVCTSAILFAVFHLNPWQGAVALPLGLWYARMVIRTGSLLPGMLSHATVNFSTSFLLGPLAMLLGFTQEQREVWRHFPPSMLVVGAAMAAAGGFVLWRQFASIPAQSGVFSINSANSLTGTGIAGSQLPSNTLTEAGPEPQSPTNL